MTPYDELSIEVRRDNFGWFGDPWPSGICYDDDGRLIDEMRKPFPAGESCLYCEEPFRAGDSGKAMPFLSAVRSVVAHAHKECALREVLGSLAHLERRCTCYGGDNETPGMTLRAEALEVWRRLQAGQFGK